MKVYIAAQTYLVRKNVKHPNFQEPKPTAVFTKSIKNLFLMFKIPLVGSLTTDLSKMKKDFLFNF